MKNLKIFEEFINESDMTRRYDGFVILDTKSKKKYKSEYIKGIDNTKAETDAISILAKKTGEPRGTFIVDKLIKKGEYGSVDAPMIKENLYEADQYEGFLEMIKNLKEKDKEQLSDMWMNSGKIVSTIASALWTSMRTGNSFKTNALNFLDKKGISGDKAQKALDDFIEKYK